LQPQNVTCKLLLLVVLVMSAQFMQHKRRMAVQHSLHPAQKRALQGVQMQQQGATAMQGSLRSRMWMQP
jgi:hypothetical protein